MRLNRLTTATLFVFALPFGVAAEEPLAGKWKGAIELPGAELQVDVDLEYLEGEWNGDISIPAQGASNLPLEIVSIDHTSAIFRIRGVPGEPTFEGLLDGDTLAGTFTQGGQSFPFRLERSESTRELTASLLDGWREWVETTLDAWDVPGAAIALVRNGEVLLAEGYGSRSLDPALPMTKDTLLPIGSATKAFTTFTLGTLADDGELDWDRPVREYLPEFDLQGDVYARHITPVDLVTHRSGYPRHDLVWYNNQDPTREELVRRLEHLEPAEGLRTTFLYNNLMYLTAGYLIEKLTGQTWEETVRERIFEPLGMERSTFSDADSMKSDDYARGYREKDGEMLLMPFREVGNMGPAGSINSNAEEMANWLLVNLQKGTFDGEQLIEPSTLRKLHTPHMHIESLPNDPEVGPTSYALGWMVTTYQGHLMVHHGGAIDGFTALVTLFPFADTGIVVLTNRNGNPLPGLITRHLFDRLETLEPRDWAGEALARRETMEQIAEEADERRDTVRVRGTEPAHDLEAYVGMYHHPGYGDFIVRRSSDSLSIVYNGIEAPVEHWHYETFSALDDLEDPTFENMKMQFETSIEGTVEAMVVPLEPFVDPIRFVKQPDPKWRDPSWLERFTGNYDFGTQTVTVSLRGSTLFVTIPGQPSYELSPEPDGWFTIVGLTGFRLRFETNENEEVTGIVSAQPNGVFEAERVD